MQPENEQEQVDGQDYGVEPEPWEVPEEGAVAEAPKDTLPKATKPRVAKARINADAILDSVAVEKAKAEVERLSQAALQAEDDEAADAIIAQVADLELSIDQKESRIPYYGVPDDVLASMVDDTAVEIEVLSVDRKKKLADGFEEGGPSIARIDNRILELRQERQGHEEEVEARSFDFSIKERIQATATKAAAETYAAELAAERQKLVDNEADEWELMRLDNAATMPFKELPDYDKRVQEAFQEAYSSHLAGVKQKQGYGESLRSLRQKQKEAGQQGQRWAQDRG